MMMKKKSIPNFRVLTILFIAFLVGVFVSSYFDIDFFRIYQIAFLLFLVLLGGIFLFRNIKLNICFAATMIFFAGFLLFSFINTKLNNLTAPFGQTLEFSGIVSSYPDISGNSQSFYLSTSDFGNSMKIYISTSAFPRYSYGDAIKVKSTIQKPTNFSDFDWVSYLKRYGATATLDNNPQIKLISNSGGNSLLKSLYRIRRNFENVVQKTLPEPESSLGIGILIGSKQGFSKSLINDFSRVGITHIIALSGYNVTIIIIFLTDILLGFISRKKIFVLSIIFIATFVAMTGAASSVIRAAIITLLIAYGKTIGRRADMANLILLSATVMVAINPFVLRYDTGFQLSFLAFVGLIYFSPILQKVFTRRIFRYVPEFVKSAVTETLSAQIFVLPLILSAFGLISVIALITNILILPIIPASMLFIFLSTLIYWIIPTIGKLALLISYLPLKYIILIAEYFSKLPISAIQISGRWQVGLIIFYALTIGIIILRHYSKNTNQFLIFGNSASFSKEQSKNVFSYLSDKIKR